MGESVEEREAAMLAEARAEVGYADHKASLVLASLGIGFAAVLAGLLAGDWKPSEQDAGESAWWIGALFAASSVVLAAAAVWPRFAVRRSRSTQVTYWGDVAAFSSVEEFAAHMGENPQASADRTRQQLWSLSRIVRRKYTLVRGSFVAAGVAVTAFCLSALQSR